MSAKIKEAPRSIWAKIVNGALFATWTDPREVHDDGQPVLRYLLVSDADTAEVDMKDAARELRTCVVEWAKAGLGSTERAAISDRFEAALSKYAAAARAPLDDAALRERDADMRKLATQYGELAEAVRHLFLDLNNLDARDAVRAALRAGGH